MSALVKFEKLFEFIDEQNMWLEFIDSNLLNVSKLAVEAEVCRSVPYQNQKVNELIIDRAQDLLERQLIDYLPFQPKKKKEKGQSDKLPMRDISGKEIAKLKDDLRRLQNKVASLKIDLKSERTKKQQLEQKLNLVGINGRLIR